MTTHLHDVIDVDKLELMLEARYVKVQVHPDLPLRIYNYTQHAQFDRVWNDVTLACRGLIVNTENQVVARPFSKFFNFGEHVDATLPQGAVHVTDKLDGSLGILYPTGSGHAVATRGSFTSEQALHATDLWRRRYEGKFQPNQDWTYLFEIIYPTNRIVVDYQGLDDLVLIGAIDNVSGRTVPIVNARKGWTGPVVEEFPYSTLEEALGAPTRDGREGIVVHFLEADLRIKIKHDEYVRLHRILTGVSERRVWEALSAGDDIRGWLEAVPDEFYTFVSNCRDQLLADHAQLSQEVKLRYDNLLSDLPEGWTRKEFAAAVVSDPWELSRAMFLVLDGRSFDHLIWAHLRPEVHLPLFSRNEDNN